jgi:hypothetical protein
VARECAEGLVRHEFAKPATQTRDLKKFLQDLCRRITS